MSNKPVGFFTQGRGRRRRVIPIHARRGRPFRIRVKPEKKERKEPEKPQKKQPKAPKIPTKKLKQPSGKMTHIEKMHLLAATKKLDLDPQEIDNTLNYEENKRHLQELARERGHTESEVTSTESEAKHWTSEYAGYLGQLIGELTNAGYTVTAPEM